MWLYIGHNHFAEPSVTMEPRKVVYTDRQQKSTHKTKLFLMETLPSKIVFFFLVSEFTFSGLVSNIYY